MTKTVSEHQAETVSQALSSGARHYPVGPDIVRLGFLELKTDGWTLFGTRQTLFGGVGHCPVGGLWKMQFSTKIHSFPPKFDF
jgi:hypothetical protein